MPELPEVTTTVNGLKKVLVGKRVTGIWTDWPKMLRPPAYARAGGEGVARFKKAVVGKRVLGSSRRGKHVLIHLSAGKRAQAGLSGNITIIVHMKMTGHLLYGKWKIENGKWKPAEKGPLNDPYNRFVHFVFKLSDGKHLAFSDARKFGKIVLAETKTLFHSPHLAHLGPEPLDKSFDVKKFTARISAKPRGKIKTVLMDQTVIAGVGNIYSDEMLWRSGIHPETRVGALKPAELKKLFRAMKEVLRGGIHFGGDSTSDYRNIYGEAGEFQEKHHAYQRRGDKCDRKNCGGIIERKMVGQRSTHFCPRHQKLRKK